MMKQKIVRSNPSQLPAPVGHYSHITKIPRNAELLVSSGQVGVDTDGHTPAAINEQTANCFLHIQQLLEAEKLSSANIVKVNIWATEEIDWDFFYQEWGKLFNKDYPAMTIAYISALGLPELKIEIELWLARV